MGLKFEQFKFEMSSVRVIYCLYFHQDFFKLEGLSNSQKKKIMWNHYQLFLFFRSYYVWHVIWESLADLGLSPYGSGVTNPGQTPHSISGLSIDQCGMNMFGLGSADET